MTIEDSVLDNIRVRAKSFIIIERDCSLTIINSTITRMDFSSSFIGNSASSLSSTEVLIQMYRVIVSGFNRDHAYSATYTGDSGFILLNDLAYFTLEECLFEDNQLLPMRAQKVSWITINTFKQVMIHSCVFRRSMHSFDFELPIETTFKSEFIVSNSTFEAEFAVNQPYMNVFISGNATVVIEDCWFVNNTSSGSEFLSLYAPSAAATIKRTNFLSNQVYIPSSFSPQTVNLFEVSGITIKNSVFFDSYATNVAAVRFITQLITAHLLNNSTALIPDLLNAGTQQCSSVLSCQNWDSVMINNVTFTENGNCEAAISTPWSAATKLTFVMKLVAVSTANIGLNIIATSSVPLHFFILDCNFSSIKESSILITNSNNMNYYVLVNHSLFENNTNCIHVKGMIILDIYHSQFIGTTDGALLLELTQNVIAEEEVTAALMIMSCLFTNNTIDVYISSNSPQAKMTLDILHSRFSLYNSQKTCGSIYLSQLQLSHALIQFCSFDRGQAPQFTGVIVTSHQVGILVLEDVLFTNHSISQSYLLYINTPNVEQQTQDKYTELRRVNVTNSVFAAAVYLQGRLGQTKLVSSNCRFEGNQGVIIWSNIGALEDSGSLFIDNIAEGNPCYFQDQQSKAVFQGTQFLSNSASTKPGGCFYLRGETSSALFRNCFFQSNSAIAAVGGVMRIEQSPKVEIYDCSFISNSALSGSALSLSNAQNSLQVANSSFTQHAGDIIELLFSNVTLINVYLANKSGSWTRGLVLISSFASAENSTFAYLTGERGCLLSATESSHVTVTNSNILFSVCSEATVEISSESNLILANCSFQHMISRTSIISLTKGTIQASYLNVQDIDSVFLSAQEADVIIRDSVFSNVRMQVIYAINSGLIIINDCSISATSEADNFLFASFAVVIQISNLKVDHAPALYIDAITILMEKCYFEALQGSMSGAATIQAAQLTISDSFFLKNRAVRPFSHGGALVIAAASTFINNCKFIANSAYQGGAIYSTLASPAMTNNIFANNMAVYGASLASSSIHRMVIFNILTIILASGQRFTGSLLIGLLDRYNQLVKSENIKTAWLIGDGLSGSLSATAANGLLKFTDFIVTGPPGSTAQVSVRSISFDVVLAVSILLRNCIQGEILEQSSCVICPDSTYSLEFNSIRCSVCPQEANCRSGNIYPNPSYWRPSQSHSTLFKCPNKEACIGHDNYRSETGKCKKPYVGNTCQSCAAGSGRKGPDKCELCPSKIMNQVLIAITVVVVLGIISIMTLFALRSSRKSTSQTSTLLKIFLNYAQMTALVACFPLQWPNSIHSFFAIHEYSGNSGEQYMSLDCMISDYFFIKQVAVALLPVVLLIVNALVWGSLWGVYRLTKRQEPVFEKCVCSTIVSVSYFHPFITRTALSAFQCVTILPGEQWVRTEMAFRCWDQRHSIFALAVSLPTIVLWGAGIPALALLLIVRYRKLLKNQNVKTMAGFLCGHYKSTLFFWEIVVIYRKVGIIVIATFMASLSASTQTLALVLLLITSSVFQFKCVPFKRTALNRAELQGLIVILATTYSGIMFSFGSLENTAESILFVFVLLLNSVYLLYLAKLLLTHQFIKLLRCWRRAPTRAVLQGKSKLSEKGKQYYLTKLQTQSLN